MPTDELIGHLDEYLDTISGTRMHPLRPKAEGIAEWDAMCGKYKTRQYQVSHMGMDSSCAEELYMKYGGYGPLKERAALYNMLYLLKQSPSYRAVVTTDTRPQIWWDQVWSSLEFFNEVVDEIHWEKRLSKWNHCPLYPYLATAIGDTYPLCSYGGELSDVLYQPKYEEEVFKILLMNDFLGNYVWFGGICCGVRADARIMKEQGPPSRSLKRGEAHLLDGGFGGRLGSVTPFPKPPKKEMPRWKTKANDGHSFVRARSEHVLTQLHAWGVCRDTYRKYGHCLPDRIQKLHWMVRAVVHIQQFLNARNVRYEPHGPWEHFPDAIFGQPKATRRHTDSDSSSSDSDTSSTSLGSFLTSAEENEE